MHVVVPERGPCQFLGLPHLGQGYRAGTMSPRLPSWLTVDEAAKRMGMSITEVYEAVHSGRLPAQRYGRSFLIRRVDADAFASSQALTA